MICCAGFQNLKETFHRLIKCDVMSSEFVALKVIFEISWNETIPVYQCLFFSLARLTLHITGIIEQIKERATILLSV